MRENEKEWEEMKTSHPNRNFINGEKKGPRLQCFLGLIYCPKTIQITKMNKTS